MLRILKIHSLIPAEKKWLALYSQPKEPFYLTFPVDFWLNCIVIDMDDLKSKHVWVAGKLSQDIPLGDDKDIVEAMSYPAILAAEVCDSGMIGNLEVCCEAGNFVRIIEDGTMTAEELTEECKPAKKATLQYSGDCQGG